MNKNSTLPVAERSKEGKQLVYDFGEMVITIRTKGRRRSDLLHATHDASFVMGIVSQEATRQSHIDSLNDGSISDLSYPHYARRFFPPDGKIPSRHNLW